MSFLCLFRCARIVDAFGDDAEGSDFDEGSQDENDDVASDHGSDVSMGGAPNGATSTAGSKSSGPTHEDSARAYGGKSVTFDLSGRNEDKAAAYDNEMDVSDDAHVFHSHIHVSKYLQDGLNKRIHNTMRIT